MREYSAKYNKTDKQKVVRLIAQKNNTDLTAQIKLILKSFGQSKTRLLRIKKSQMKSGIN